MQGSEYAGVPPAPKHKNLEEWFQEVSVVPPFREEPNAIAFGCISLSVYGDIDKRVGCFRRILDRSLLVKQKTSRWSGLSVPIDPLRKAT